MTDMFKKVAETTVNALGYTLRPHATCVDEQGVAAKGYDVVAYYDEHAAFQGRESDTAEFNYALYWFKNGGNAIKFTASPGLYAPMVRPPLAIRNEPCTLPRKKQAKQEGNGETEFGKADPKTPTFERNAVRRVLHHDVRGEKGARAGESGTLVHTREKTVLLLRPRGRAEVLGKPRQVCGGGRGEFQAARPTIRHAQARVPRARRTENGALLRSLLRRPSYQRSHIRQVHIDSIVLPFAFLRFLCISPVTMASSEKQCPVHVQACPARAPTLRGTAPFPG